MEKIKKERMWMETAQLLNIHPGLNYGQGPKRPCKNETIRSLVIYQTTSVKST